VRVEFKDAADVETGVIFWRIAGAILNRPRFKYEGGKMTFDAFQDKLSLDLMNNSFAGAQPKVSDSSPKHNSPLLHDFRTIKSVMEGKAKNKNKSCSICSNKNATMFCLPCSITAGNYPKKLVAVCTPGASASCIGKHIQSYGH
jgi:hypothetical protein